MSMCPDRTDLGKAGILRYGPMRKRCGPSAGSGPSAAHGQAWKLVLPDRPHLQCVAAGEDQRDVTTLGRHVDIGREHLPCRPHVEVLPHVAPHSAGVEHDAHLPRNLDLHSLSTHQTDLRSKPPST